MLKLILLAISMQCLLANAQSTGNSQYPTNCAFSHFRLTTLQLQEESNPFVVYCEQQLFGGGWTVILNRFNGSVDFYNRTMREFRSGFGVISPLGEYFIGLDKLYALTNSRKHETIFILEDFRNETFSASYNYFKIDDITNFHKVSDLLGFNTDRYSDFPLGKFCAFDTCKNTAVFGWQLPNLLRANYVSLFGKYANPNSNETVANGELLSWQSYNCQQDRSTCLKSVQMLIRPVNDYFYEDVANRNAAHADVQF